MTKVRPSNAGNVSHLFENFCSEKKFGEIEVMSIKDIVSYKEFPIVLITPHVIDLVYYGISHL